MLYHSRVVHRRFGYLRNHADCHYLRATSSSFADSSASHRLSVRTYSSVDLFLHGDALRSERIRRRVWRGIGGAERFDLCRVELDREKQTSHVASVMSGRLGLWKR